MVFLNSRGHSGAGETSLLPCSSQSSEGKLSFRCEDLLLRKLSSLSVLEREKFLSELEKISVG